MTRLRGLWTAPAAAALLLLSACAQPIVDGDPAAPAGSSAPPAVAGDADTLVLRVAHTGGFVAAETIPTRLPLTSVYADGRVISNGAVVLSYPGPALPNLQVVAISPAALQELLGKAVAAGVRTGADFGQAGVTDVPETEVTVRTADGVQTISVSALGEARADDPNLTAGQLKAREKLRAFIEELDKLAIAGQPVQYEPETLAAVVQPYVEPGDNLPGRPPTKQWTGPALPGEPLSQATKLTCVAATGTQAEGLLKAASDATQITPWVAGGKNWTVHFRPLLPDEAGCADLKAQK